MDGGSSIERYHLPRRFVAWSRKVAGSLPAMRLAHAGVSASTASRSRHLPNGTERNFCANCNRTPYWAVRRWRVGSHQLTDAPALSSLQRSAPRTQHAGAVRWAIRQRLTTSPARAPAKFRLPMLKRHQTLTTPWAPNGRYIRFDSVVADVLRPNDIGALKDRRSRSQAVAAHENEPRLRKA